MIYKIVLYVCVVISILGFIFCLFEFISQWIKKGKKEWGTLIIGLFFIPALVAAILFSCLIYIYDVWNAGGIKKYYGNKKKEKAEAQERAIEAEKRKREKERIAKAFRDGELKREELPRKENGINRFEFYEEMGLKVEEYGKVREIIYVENGYNECLNSFFMRHQNLRLYKMYKFVYLYFCLSSCAGI